MQERAVADQNRILRKAYSSLIVAGRGVILFGGWGFVKAISLIFFGSAKADISSVVAEYPEYAHLIWAFAVLVSFVMIAAFESIYFFVGWKAVQEGQRKKTGHWYLILAFLLFISSICTIANEILGWMQNSVQPESIATIFVEMTFCIAIVDLIYHAVIVRKYSKVHIYERG